MELYELFDELIVGTNEEFILGFQILPNENECVTLKPSFTNHAHMGRVKQVAVNQNYLVTGSTDEYIKIFNLSTRQEIGYIRHHCGTVTCLHFHKSGFLFSGSEDGVIGIFRTNEWKLLKELKGHQSTINGFAVHPSGKLGLSISKDKRVITWDLLKGKKAHVAGLKKPGEFIIWSPDGSHYLISVENILNIYSIEHGNIVHSIDFKENIYCFSYITDKLIVVGGERKTLVLFDLEKETEILQWEAHENRTKALVPIVYGHERFQQIASASSDGFIKIWMFDLLNIEQAPKLLGEVDTKSRITCMTMKPKSKNARALTALQIEEIVSEKSKKMSDKLAEEHKKNLTSIENEESALSKPKVYTEIIVEDTMNQETKFRMNKNNQKKFKINKNDQKSNRINSSDRSLTKKNNNKSKLVKDKTVRFQNVKSKKNNLKLKNSKTKKDNLNTIQHKVQFKKKKKNCK